MVDCTAPQSFSFSKSSTSQTVFDRPAAIAVDYNWDSVKQLAMLGPDVTAGEALTANFVNLTADYTSQRLEGPQLDPVTVNNRA